MVLYQTPQLPCGVFDINNPTAPSSETFYFMSSHCVDGTLQYGVGVAWSLLTIVTFLIQTFFFIRMYIQKKTWALPCTVLAISMAMTFSLLLVQISYLFAFRGYLRAIVGGLIMVVTVPGATFMVKTWFLAILSSHLSHQAHLQTKVRRWYLIINVSFQIFFWVAMITAGAYDITDINKNNIVVGIWYAVAAIYTIIMGIGIYMLGKQITKTVGENSKEAANSIDVTGVKKVLQKIGMYSFLQSNMMISSGVGALGLALWSLISYFQEDTTIGMPYYYYIQQFWLFPSLYCMGILITYIGVNNNSSSSGSSRPSDSIHSARNPKDSRNSAHLEHIQISIKAEEVIADLNSTGH